MVMMSMLVITDSATDIPVSCSKKSVVGNEDVAVSIAQAILNMVNNTPSSPKRRTDIRDDEHVSGKATCSSSGDACRACLLGIVGALEQKCLNGFAATVKSPDGCFLSYKGRE
ncbi:hypothetical protein LINPERPRIM_LOCUS2240 [Linum perenne]